MVELLVVQKDREGWGEFLQVDVEILAKLWVSEKTNAYEPILSYCCCVSWISWEVAWLLLLFLIFWEHLSIYLCASCRSLWPTLMSPRWAPRPRALQFFADCFLLTHFMQKFQMLWNIVLPDLKEWRPRQLCVVFKSPHPICICFWTLQFQR